MPIRALLAALALLILHAPFAAAAQSSRERAALLGIPEDARVEPARLDRSIPLELESSLPRATDGLGDANGKWFIGSPPTYIPSVTAYDSTLDRLLLFAGEQYSENVGWELALGGDETWQPLARSDGPQPPALVHAVGVRDTRRNRMIVFGGDIGSFRLSTALAIELEAAPRWSSIARRTPALVPPVRQRAYGAYDSKRDRLVVFAGWGDSVLADAWALTLGDSADWQELHPLGPGPTPRMDGTAVYDPIGDRLLVFGGLVETSPHLLDAVNELWELDFADTLRWRRVNATGDVPPPLSEFGSAWDEATQSLLVIGGRGKESNVPYLYDPRLETWTRLAPTGSPLHSNYGTLTFDRRRDRYLLYGGGYRASNERDVDVLTLRPSPQWSSLAARALPKGRFGQATVHDTRHDRMLIFGGVSADGYLSDVQSIELADPLHVSPFAVQGASPPPRHEPVGIYDPLRDRAVFFGGWTYESNYFSDVWTLSLDGEPSWTQAFPEGSTPEGRRAHAAVYDPLRDRMLVFGGLGDSTVLGDVWALDLAGTMRWTQLVPTNEGPGPRFFMSVTYMPAEDAVLFYGGRVEYSTQGDIWRLDLGDLSWHRLDRGYSPELECQVVSYDSARDRFLVHGGRSIDYDVGFDFPWTIAFVLRPAPHWEAVDPDQPWPNSTERHSQVYDARRDRLVSFAGNGWSSSNDRAYLQFAVAADRHAWPLAATTAAGTAHVVWEVVEQPGAALTVERMEEGGTWQVLGPVVADENARVTFDDTALRAGWRYSYRLRIVSPAGNEEAGAISLDIPGASNLEFLGARPNPARGSDFSLWFSLPAPGEARITIHDLRGRLVWSERMSGLAAGPQIALPNVRLAPGLYFAEVSSAGQRLRRKVTVLP
jgi:hypothetical protein